MSNRTIHIVSHTHWDREWYFSTCDSKVLMDPTITSILHELENNKHVNFCLDGQISIVEEYIKLHPEMREVMQRLVDEYRLFVGPWYTQSDVQLVSMTSIINNLYYGIYDTKQLFNTYMNIGYLPDTFGFSNQLPMLLKQFEIDDFIFWRGIDYEKQNISPYFIWQGMDGSKVTAANLPNGYAMAQGLNSSETFIHNIFEPMLQHFDDITNADDILVTVGGDQHTIVKNLNEKIKELPGKLKIGSYQEFMDIIRPQVKETYTGEFREGKFSRVHKSAGSIRTSIKMSNYKVEQALVKGLEPLNIMAQQEGFPISHALIDEAWKLLFEGQAHDGIVGCVSDSVASDLLNRNKRALEIAQAAQNYIKKQFAVSIALQKDEILIFNTEPHPFKGYKTIEIISHEPAVTVEGVTSCALIESKKYNGCPNALIETPEGKFYEKEDDYYFHTLRIQTELPSMGYKVLKFKACDKKNNQSKRQFIENDKYRIYFENQDIVLEKDGIKLHQFIRLEDIGNDGDTYDFSPLLNDETIVLHPKSATVKIFEHLQIMEIDFTHKLPYDLENRITKKMMQECPCKVILELRDDALIYTRVQFDNKVLSHRLRLKVRGFKQEAKTMAATPGGFILRDVYNKEADTNWNKTHVEYPIDIETNSGFVSFYGEEEQLAIFNKGCKEYQAINDSIYMTLFATTQELGKPDLLYRPGRASGDTTKKGHVRIQTPLAQELHMHDYTFAIGFMEPKGMMLYQTLQQFESEDIFYQLQDINLFYERIDNKIQALDIKRKALPQTNSYLNMPKHTYVYNMYHSLYDKSVQIRFMCFHDMSKTEAGFHHDTKIGNLLEHGDENQLKAYRIYTVKGANL